VDDLDAEQGEAAAGAEENVPEETDGDDGPSDLAPVSWSQKPVASTEPSVVDAPQVPQDVPAGTEHGVFGNRRSKKLHQKGCRFGDKTSAHNRVVFRSVEEALGRGFKRCGACFP
jgi:hypothetical protein